MRFNYQTICHSNLLKDLAGRQKDIIVRRFGLRGERETLESIGQSYGITRERVRQVEEDGLRRAREKLDSPVCRNVFQYFVKYLKGCGSLKREDLLLEELGGEKFKNHVFFLLTLGQSFERFGETEDLYAFWATDKNALNVVRKVISEFTSKLEKESQPLPLSLNILPSYIEISKDILKSGDGLYGLKTWPEVNPRGIKDMAYIAFKKEKTPLHFSKVASLVQANLQTVHNELIKDPRFVLVGRGIYALREWGYEPGVVREVISGVLTQAQAPLAREEILEEVLKQRQVKPNTVLLNLQNKKYFVKNPEGKYTIREA